MKSVVDSPCWKTYGAEGRTADVNACAEEERMFGLVIHIGELGRDRYDASGSGSNSGHHVHALIEELSEGVAVVVAHGEQEGGELAVCDGGYVVRVDLI